MGMIQLLALTLLVFAQAHASVKDLQEWELFKIKYAKEYTSQDEENIRKDIFLKNLQHITEHNERYNRGEVTFSTGMNEYSDWTYEEHSAHHYGYRYFPANESNETKILAYRTVSRLPASVDWRTKGAVTPVKNQFNCSSCWAFSAVGSIESQHFLKHKKLVALSEQNLVDCAENRGCGPEEGGLLHLAFQWVIDNKGIATAESYPYEDKKSECRFKSENIGATISRYVKIPTGDELALQHAVATNGPVSAAIYAGSLFSYYHEGVYEDPDCSKYQSNHAILIVGYGTTRDGQDYWIVKNSHGTTFGMDGYIWMSRNKNNMCNIASGAYLPIME